MPTSRGSFSRSSGACDLSGLPAFRDLPPKIIAQLEGIGRQLSFRAGETIVDEGDTPSFVGCVVDGILRMQKTLPDGRQHIVGLLVESDIFGRVFDGPQHFAVEAATDAVVCTFRRAPFEALIARTPELERLVMLNLLDELDRAREWMMILANHKVTGRLAGFLLVLCTRFAHVDHLIRAKLGKVEVKIPITRTDISHLLGARPESISRAFHALADAGVISMKSPFEIEITDMEALLAESGEEDSIDADMLNELMAIVERRSG